VGKRGAPYGSRKASVKETRMVPRFSRCLGARRTRAGRPCTFATVLTMDCRRTHCAWR